MDSGGAAVSWNAIVHDEDNFKVSPSDGDATWEVPAWGNHFYGYELITPATMMLTWRLEATRVTGTPLELRIALPNTHETDYIGGQQWVTMFYNDNWQPGAPTKMERGMANTGEMQEGQTWVTLTRDTLPLDILPQRWSTTISAKRPGGVGYLGGTYLFGTIIMAVRERT